MGNCKLADAACCCLFCKSKRCTTMTEVFCSFCWGMHSLLFPALLLPVFAILATRAETHVFLASYLSEHSKATATLCN